jgi:hypothetical protein
MAEATAGRGRALRRAAILWALALFLLAIPVFIVAAAYLAAVAPTSPVRGKPEAAPGRPDAPVAGGGGFRERLAQLPSTEQGAVLGKLVGADCAGELAFFMGEGARDADKGDRYWSVKCADGRSYALALHPGAAANASVFGCDVIKSAGMTCFRRIAR